MKRLLTPLVIVFGICAEPPPTSAAIPVRWRVETSRVQPAQFIAYHGETLRLEAALQSDGKPLDITNEALICWQTNGMGSTYWSAPAATSNNVLSAHFTPAMDPGADLVNGFLGIPGENWRAAFQLRLRPSPGVDPAALPLPVLTLDFSKVEVLNAPWPGNYAAVSNAAVNALSRAEAKAGFTEWTITPPTYEGSALHVSVNSGGESPAWYLRKEDDEAIGECVANEDATSLNFSPYVSVTATRTRLPTMADIAAATNYTDSATNSLASRISTLETQYAAITNMLDGLEAALRTINGGNQ